MTIKYEFTLPDGSKRYEFVDPDSDFSVMTQLSMFKGCTERLRSSL